MSGRDRDPDGRPRNARPRDGLGRPLDHAAAGVPPVPDDLHLDGPTTLATAQELLDSGAPFQAHEVLEARWKTCPAGERSYWQGLAQAAVALTHLRRGNTVGARRLADRAAGHLSGCEVPGGSPGMGDVLAQLAAIAAGRDDGLRVLP